MTRVVLHADDVGVYKAANDAFVELAELGTITAGSVMTTCPWFPDIAARVAGDDRYDVGVHLTLTAEKAGYKWSALGGIHDDGLTDPNGYLWRHVAQAREHADPDAVEGEWRRQIERALHAGIDVTHLDAHMGAALAPEWCDRYIALGVEYRVPVLITRTLASYGPNKHIAGLSEERWAHFVGVAEAAGMPIFDRCLESHFRRTPDTPADYRPDLAALNDDLVFCAFHPATPGDVEDIEPATAHIRIGEYDLFGSPSWRRFLTESDVEPISMRQLRDEYRQS